MGEAESTLSQFRSRERVFASASARAEKSTDVQESEVVVKKTINKVSVGGAATSSSAFSSSQESSSALQQSSDVRAGSVAYSRAGSVARAGGSSSSYRASSMAASRAGSMSRVPPPCDTKPSTRPCNSPSSPHPLHLHLGPDTA